MQQIFSLGQKRGLLHFQEEKQESFPTAYRLTEILFLDQDFAGGGFVIGLVGWFFVFVF